mmetsp:Transcript_17542/g.8273  ORF Transcript_17542/g.8273 Transcript_17542/m.8273 type:complete len:105 (+) Transcript_17542:185-499(+)
MLNEIIAFEFEFTDEEVVSNYISMLKSLSLKLNSETLNFFMNESSFPLYTCAIKFCQHREPMVRTAVRTLTLNVFRTMDEATEALVLKPSLEYFTYLANFLISL